MDVRRLYEILDEIEKQYIDFWVETCEAESPTADKLRVDACAQLFIDKARQKGWEIEINRQEKAGNPVSITMNKCAKGAPVILSGHLDTVHPVGLFGYPAVKIDGDKIFGPGVTDCKGGVVAGFMAMDALERAGFTERPITLILQTDEEGGSRMSNKKTIEYMCEKSRGAVAFLNLEPACIDNSGKYMAVIERKGIERLIFKVTGKEAHSSTCATLGANAIAEAASKIAMLDKLKDENGLTCNIGTIKGGSVSNTVAGYCEFEVDARYATVEQRDWFRAYAKSLAEENRQGCTCEIAEGSQRIAMVYSQANVDLLQKINQIATDNGLAGLVASKELGGSDAAYVTASGTPCVDSLGVIGGGIHSVAEYAEICSLKQSAIIQALTCAFIKE